ncbi:MAG: phosphotransferase family protein [Nitrospira sp.]|nr:phosphotransferase family protein [Nitrospira sp.]
MPDVSGPLIVEQFPGGHSNLTYLVRWGEKEMVLRRPPFGNRVKTAHDMGREYRVLSRLHKVYVPAPRPLAYCEDGSILGAPFYLMERRYGIILRQALPPGLYLNPETVRHMSESFIDNLAHLHSIDYQAVGLGDLGRPEGYVQRHVEGWTKRYRNAQTDEIPYMDQIIPWLTERIPKGNDAALIHNDYKYDNLMLDPHDFSRIVAVLDWEMCTLGDPLTDLGTTLGYWIQPNDFEAIKTINASDLGLTALPGSPPRHKLAERYAQKTNRDISNLLFYYCFGLFKTAVIVQQIYYRYVHGYTQDERFANLHRRVVLLSRIAVHAIEVGKF